MVRRFLLALAVVLLPGLLGCDGTASPPDAPDQWTVLGGKPDLPGPVSITRVAIYDDTASPSPGAWAEGLTAIEELLRREGLASERITRTQLNHDAFDLSPYAAIVFGGGYAYPGYTLNITEDAKGRLRAYVEAGGVYLGICAGAYFACARIRWEGIDYDEESGYTLDLMPGLCAGPLAGVPPFPNWSMIEIGYDPHPALGDVTERFIEPIQYAGGPVFFPDSSTTTVVATYEGADLPERGEPAVVVTQVGAGTVVLWGPHPEVPWPGSPPDVGWPAGQLLTWALRTP